MNCPINVCFLFTNAIKKHTFQIGPANAHVSVRTGSSMTLPFSDRHFYVEDGIYSVLHAILHVALFPICCNVS